MKFADGEGYGVCDRWQEAAAPADKVLSEGHLCVEAKVEATVSAPAMEGPAAAPAPEAWSAGVGAFVVGRYCFWGRVGRLGSFC